MHTSVYDTEAGCAVLVLEDNASQLPLHAVESYTAVQHTVEQ